MGLQTSRQTNLYLHKDSPPAHDNYRVIWKDDGLEIETGSIGVSGTYVRFTDTDAALFA